MSCYTFLREFRLPWPSFYCQNQFTFFVGSINLHFATLTRFSVHPALPILLTNIGPLTDYNIRRKDSIRQSKRSAIFGVCESG